MTDTAPEAPARLAIGDSFYIAALKGELDKVNAERILLRAALDQQAATVVQLAAEHQRIAADNEHLTGEVERLTGEVAALVAERDQRTELTTDRYPGPLETPGEVNGAVPAHCGP